MTLILRHDDVVGLLTIDEVIQAVRSGLEEQADGEVQVPPRTTIDSNAGYGWLRVMPAILNRSRVMGFKAMHSTPGVGVGYFVALYDLPTGELLAQMDADWLTSQRTAATAAIGVDVMARKQISCVGVLGSSEQARRLLAATARVRDLQMVKVYSPTPENRRAFAEKMGEQLGLTIVPVDCPKDAVIDSDLLLSAFRAGSKPVVSAEWIGPGTHVSAASSVRPEARELEDGVWRKSSVVAVDDRKHAFESGDGKSVVASKSFSPEMAVELWEVVGGQKIGRSTEDSITLFKSVGTALQDLALAKAIYDKVKTKCLGQDVGAFPRMRASS